MKLDRSLLIRIAATPILLASFLIYMYGCEGIVPCIFNKLTHLYCPGCGFTRALHAALHLQFAKATAYNPLFIPFSLFAVYFFGVSYLNFVFKLKIPNVKFTELSLSLLLLFLLLFTLVRNSFFYSLMPD